MPFKTGLLFSQNTQIPVISPKDAMYNVTKMINITLVVILEYY